MNRYGLSGFVLDISSLLKLGTTKQDRIDGFIMKIEEAMKTV